jgi:hypothetical protein
MLFKGSLMPLDNYETVAERIEKFWVKFPNGRIDVKLIFQDGTRYIVQCDLFKDIQDMLPFSSDFAEEIRTTTNRFPLENCTTSAIGRSLHTGSISKFSEGIARPSFEEMRRVNLTSPHPQPGEPMAIANAVDETMDQILTNTQPAQSPQCDHGFMISKMGVNSKTGKSYSGFVCGSKVSPCKPIWN